MALQTVVPYRSSHLHLPQATDATIANSAVDKTTVLNCDHRPLAAHPPTAPNILAV